MQFHPVTDAPEHVDFQRLAPGEPIRVSVPVHFENDGLSPGLKRGGVLNVIRHTVEVYAQPEHIPEQFTADLAELDFNDAVRWEDLKGTENTPPGDRPQLRGRDCGAADQAGRSLGRADGSGCTGGSARSRGANRRSGTPAAARSGLILACHAALGRPRQSGAGDGPEPA